MAVPVVATINQNGDGIVFSSLNNLLRLQSQLNTLYLAKKHIRARHAGLHKSVYKGRGMDFAESRPYQPGDDIRTIDWRVTARSGRVHTKVFEEEREKPVMVWVDLRPAMFFATRGRFKAVIATEVAALLLWKTLDEGDRIGGVIQNGQHVELKPSRSRSAALHFLRQLSDLTQSGRSRSVLAENQQENDLQASWTRLRRVAQAGSQVFVISDFRKTTPAALRQLALITRHAQLTLISIHDPFEEQPPAQGNVRLTDGKQKLWVNLGQQLWRKHYIERHQQAYRSLQDFSRNYRVPWVQLSTADSTHERLLKLSWGLK